MPAGSVACMIIWPFLACTGMPLTSMLTISSAMSLGSLRRQALTGPGSAIDQGAALVLDHVLELVAKMLDEALHRPRRGIAECADGVPLDAVRHIDQQGHVLGAALAVDDPAQHAIHPAGALAARRALAAGLGHVEACPALERPHHAGGLVHDDDCAGAERGTGLLERVIVHVGAHHGLT